MGVSQKLSSEWEASKVKHKYVLFGYFTLGVKTIWRN